jgi:branched-chain amino acid transport system permease protein
VALGVAVAFLLVVPYFFEGFWLQVGLFCMAAAIGAIGLTLLVGITGQLSLGHAFFIAIGAYGYCFFAADKPLAGLSSQPEGLGLPTAVAAVAAVALAGLAGAVFSPIAGRLRGIYLGLASIGLVFIGERIMFNAEGVTGGFTGRDAAAFNVFGFHFANAEPDLTVLGVPFQQLERLWYLGLVLVLFAWWFARNLVHSRPGRALQQVRDSEIAAAVMGVNVPAYKAWAFTFSSMYAGLAGVLYALAYQRIVPESFGFLFSIDFLVMIVIGGLGSIGGAIAGAVLVTALPQLLDRYAESLPLVVAPGADGLQSAEAARFIYGTAVVVILIFAPRGLAGLMARLARRRAAIPATVQPKESTA